jgi:hypothetical protein
LIYRGWGFIALLIPIITILIGTSLFGVNGNASLEVFLYSLLASGPIVFFLGIWMNRRGKHDMWFVPFQYWGIIWAVIALGVLALKR